MSRLIARSISGFSHDAYNCFVSVRQSPKNLERGPLLGTAFAAKDNIATLLEPTTCASLILRDYQSPFEATVVKQLIAAGLALVGKTNMDEFGMGSSTTFSHFGATLNPNYAEPRVAGGSSGGSAAAVASGLADFALGTDTGGSVRQPGSYCGVVGFKPSYGRISRYGVIPYAQGFDCVGILAKSVAMTKRVFDVLDQEDKKDITSLPQEVRDKISKQPRNPKEKLRVGIPNEFILSELLEETVAEIEKVVLKLIALGHEVRSVSLPSIKKLISAYYTLATAEAATNLLRFDGIRFGLAEMPAEPNADPKGMTLITGNRFLHLGPEVQRRIVLGNYTLSSESGNTFLRATRLRRDLVQELNSVFASPNPIEPDSPGASEGCDVLLGPTTFGRAPTVEETAKDRAESILNEYLNDVFTIPASMGGLPAISVPCEDRDFGVQIIGQYGDDRRVLEVAELVESR